MTIRGANAGASDSNCPGRTVTCAGWPAVSPAQAGYNRKTP